MLRSNHPAQCSYRTCHSPLRLGAGRRPEGRAANAEHLRSNDPLQCAYRFCRSLLRLGAVRQHYIHF